LLAAEPQVEIRKIGDSAPVALPARLRPVIAYSEDIMNALIAWHDGGRAGAAWSS
jgi:hypothetical protein